MNALEKITQEHGRLATHLRFPRYLVAETGAVISLVSGEPRVLKTIRRGKYPGFTLVDRAGKLRAVYLHRLVAETFHGAPQPGEEVRHHDGDRENGAASNVVWGTRSQNMRDKERHGTALRGQKHGGAKLTEFQVRMIRKFAEVGVPRKLVCERYGISQANHGRIINNQLWTHIQ